MLAVTRKNFNLAVTRDLGGNNHWQYLRQRQILCSILKYMIKSPRMKKGTRSISFNQMQQIDKMDYFHVIKRHSLLNGVTGRARTYPLFWNSFPVSGGFDHFGSIKTTKSKFMIKMKSASVVHPTLINWTCNLCRIYDNVLHVSPSKVGAIKRTTFLKHFATFLKFCFMLLKNVIVDNLVIDAYYRIRTNLVVRIVFL